MQRFHGPVTQPGHHAPVDGFRFLHTADTQLGMRRRFLDADAQARYTDARFEALATMAGLAREHRAEAIVVAGDVFETNQVDRRTVGRACEILRASPVPVHLLPGNHDPLDASSVYRREDFRAACPDHVVVLETPGEHEIRPGVRLVAAPWASRRPGRDLVAEVLAGLEPDPGVIRVLVGHGGVDALTPQGSEAERLSLAAMEAAVSDGRIAYCALGDRHSATRLSRTGRIWYAGTPEPTDFDEVRPGYALLVDLAPAPAAAGRIRHAAGAEAAPAQGSDRLSPAAGFPDGPGLADPQPVTRAAGCTVTELPVGRWSFQRASIDVSGPDGVLALRAFLDSLADKRRTVLRLSLCGTVGLAERLDIDYALDEAAALFAALDPGDRDDLVVLLDDEPDDLGLGGFAQTAYDQLREDAPADPDAQAALALLYRLAGGGDAGGRRGAA